MLTSPLAVLTHRTRNPDEGRAVGVGILISCLNAAMPEMSEESPLACSPICAAGQDVAFPL